MQRWTRKRPIAIEHEKLKVIAVIIIIIITVNIIEINCVREWCGKWNKYYMDSTAERNPADLLFINAYLTVCYHKAPATTVSFFAAMFFFIVQSDQRVHSPRSSSQLFYAKSSRTKTSRFASRPKKTFLRRFRRGNRFLVANWKCLAPTLRRVGSGSANISPASGSAKSYKRDF